MGGRSRHSLEKSITWICVMPMDSRCAFPSCGTRRMPQKGAKVWHRGRHMKARETNRLIVGLDVGTSKIAAIVAEIKPEGGVEIIGMGSHPSRGLKKGVVVNIDTTVSAIQRALEEAELMADCKIREVYTGIAGSHIKSFNSQGMVAIKDKEVVQMDIDRVIETAKAVQIPNDQ